MTLDELIEARQKGIKKKMKTKTHEEMIRQVREAGESLIKNAESIVGNEEYLVHNMTVTININMIDIEAPTIEVKREFLPEMFVKRMRV